MYAEMGHNSRAFAEDLFEASANTVKPSDAEPIRFLYVPMHVGDWVSGTLGLSIELEGAYCRFIVRLYERGKAFPNDDRVLSTCMGLSIRVWKRVKQALIDLGKIVIRNGCLTNSRFEKERLKRAETLRKQAESARKRHERERRQKQSLPEVSAKFGESLGQTSAKHLESTDKKVNEINGREVGQLPNPESDIRNPIKERLATTESVETRNAGLAEAVNDRTSAIVGKVAKWINPFAPDYATAQKWLSSTIVLFGESVVRDAYADMLTKMADGKTIAAPLPLFTKICQGHAERREKARKAVESKDQEEKYFKGARELGISIEQYRELAKSWEKPQMEAAQ